MLEFIGEFIMELFSVPVESFFESKRIRPWVKNLVMGIFWAAVAGLLLWATVRIIRAGNPWPMCLMCIVADLIWLRVGTYLWKERRR